MEARHELAKGTALRWAHHTPNSKALPEHGGDKKQKRQKAASFSSFLALVKGAAYQVQTGLGQGLPAMPALRPAGPPQGPGAALPKANPLTRVGTNQNAHQQPGAPLPQNQPQNPVPPPTGWQPSVAAQAANPNDITGMLLRHAEALLNKGQSMPQKRASSLPSKLQVLEQTSSGKPTSGATNSARTLLDSAQGSAQLVLEKCAQIKKAWPYYRGYRPPRGYHPMAFQGYPQQPYGFHPLAYQG